MPAQENNHIVYVIAGPTAVGKTAVAIRLARHLGTDIISADSRQCYQQMTIGTAKPSLAELQEVKHYFIDEYPVTSSLTASDYETLALGYLSEIFQKSNTAVVCGGTGLYIKALCEGLDDMPGVDDTIVHEVNQQYEANGLPWLQRAVQSEDHVFYERSEIKNPARLIRALVFKRSTGESIINFQTGKRKPRPFRTIKIGLELPREVLYDNINRRVDLMMTQGLLHEVKALYALKHLKNLQTVGYSELFDHLDGKCSLAEAVEKIKQSTRHYAKRQLTWFRKDTEMNWFSPYDNTIVEQILGLQ